VTGLYECLVQIRALRDTAQRLTGFVSAGPATAAAPAVVDLLRRRAQLELTHAEWLALLLGTGVPAPAQGEPDETAAAAVEAFLAAREANLALLEKLRAGELEQAGVLPDGRPAAVTDVVAMMVAADTDAVAALREAVPLPTDDPQGGP